MAHRLAIELWFEEDNVMSEEALAIVALKGLAVVAVCREAHDAHGRRQGRSPEAKR